MFFLTTALENTIWLVFLIFFAVIIYTWSKSKVLNNTIAIIITIFIVYILFFRFPNLVWVVAVGIIIYFVYGSDSKKLINGILFNKKK